MQLINNTSKDKLRGGFYTPKAIAKFILKWCFNGSSTHDVLEPSCGDGVFLEEMKNGGYKFKSVTAIELDPDEALKARETKLNNTEILNTDFHQFCISTNKRFDFVIGNPPYIRYQFFNKEQQSYAAEIFNKADMKYSKLTNSWVSFVVGASLLLKPEGKIAFVLPAEILQVSYAKCLREYLAHHFNKINIISFEKLVFPDIQQEVVLLLCEKNSSDSHLIEHIEVRDSSLLESLDVARLKSPKKRIDFKSNKWTFYFLNQKEIDFLEAIKKENTIPRFEEFAKVEVGITTGSNPFFTVPLSVVKEYDLYKFAKPLVGRSVQVPSVIFTKSDWNKNRKCGARTHLLTFPVMSHMIKEVGAEQYISWGREQDIHKGYKCRIRDEWQIIPSLRISDALFIRRNNLYPKLIINQAKAYTTDTMHRVTVRPNSNIKSLTASYYNSLSLAFTEICGRSHGGGVLELMPNEVEEIRLPYHENNADLLSEIDEMIRGNKHITEILNMTNKKVLKENYGMSFADINLANGIWMKLSQRRLNRKHQ